MYHSPGLLLLVVFQVIWMSIGSFWGGFLVPEWPGGLDWGFLRGSVRGDLAVLLLRCIVDNLFVT